MNVYSLSDCDYSMLFASFPSSHALFSDAVSFLFFLVSFTSQHIQKRFLYSIIETISLVLLNISILLTKEGQKRGSTGTLYIQVSM